MERKKKVIDASVVTKWFVHEEGSDRALQIREDHINGKILIIVPELLFLEVVNALRYKQKSKAELNNVVSDLLECQLRIENLDEEIFKEAIHLSLTYDLSLYDAIYASLATLFDTELITADEKLLKAPRTVKL